MTSSLASIQVGVSILMKDVMVLLTVNKVKMKNSVVQNQRLGVTWM